MSIKSLFVKEEDDVPVIEEQPKKKASSKPTSIGLSSVTPAPSPSQFATVGVSMEDKNEFAEFLNSVYEQGNFQGPDYQEFTDALKTMDSQPIPENVKFTAIYAGFQVQNVTKARLIDTGNKYMIMIDDQVTGFNAEIEKKLKTEIAAKQTEATKISTENDNIEKQMIALTEKKNKNVEAIQRLTSEVNEETSSLNIKKASFKLAADEFKAKVQDNLQKIKTYLPEPVTK